MRRVLVGSASCLGWLCAVCCFAQCCALVSCWLSVLHSVCRLAVLVDCVSGGDCLCIVCLLAVLFVVWCGMDCAHFIGYVLVAVC